MKRKTDWADKVSWRCAEACWDRKQDGQVKIAIALRAAERRGFKRVVKLLRMMAVGPDTNWQNWADWIEDQDVSSKPKRVVPRVKKRR